MATIAKAALFLEVNWTAFAKGIFRIGTSQIGMTDTLGVSPADPRWSGTYTAIGTRLREASWSRGRSDDLSAMESGAATFTVDDDAGDFNPSNASSPLAGLLEDRLHPVRFGATYSGGTVGLFSGFVRRIRTVPGRRRSFATFECVDLFYWLEDAKPIIASTGITTTGAAIGKILDAIGWLDPAGRSLAEGDTIPDFAADGTSSGLDLIRELLEAERGLFYINGSGVAVYESRHTRSLRSSSATISDVMRAVNPGVDADRVANIVVVERSGGTPATSTDEESRRRFGDKELAQITTPYLTTDDQASSLGLHILGQTSAPRPPLRDLTIDSRTAELLEQVLERELVDVVTVSEAMTGTSGVYHLERISGSVRPSGLLSAAWVLSEKVEELPLVLGAGHLGGPEALVY